MLIHPCKKNLVDCISDIENSKVFEFLIKPKYIFPGILNLDRGIEIPHIDMWGPVRQPGYKTNREESYNGPYWSSTIEIYPNGSIISTREATELFQEELKERGKELWITGGEQTGTIRLRYDFLKPQQPERNDDVEVITHRITFAINCPQENGGVFYKDTKARFEKRKLDDFLKHRIFFPPAPRQRWENADYMKTKVREMIAQNPDIVKDYLHLQK